MTWLSLEDKDMTSKVGIIHVRDVAKKDEIKSFTELS